MKPWLLIAPILVIVTAVLVYSRLNQPVVDQVPTVTAPIENPDYTHYPPPKPSNTLFLLLHGGSWMVGDKLQLDAVGRYLSGLGFSVINLNYRLAPVWQYDAPLKDIAAAINRVEADLTAYGLTENYHLVLLGFSAGGHLAAQFCLSEAEYRIKQADACIGLAGIYDLLRITQGETDPLLLSAVESFLGTASAQIASPLYHINPGEPTRFLLIQGNQDTVVSPTQMQTFEAKLKANQVAVETLIVPGKDHLSIFNTIPQDDIVAQKILDFIR